LDRPNDPSSPSTFEQEASPPETGATWEAIAKELIETAFLALVIFVALRLFVQNFRIEGHSMEPNLHDGQFLIVDKVSYKLHEPERGDVVIFHAPPAPNKDFIKRVMGLPGEEIEMRKGVVYVNNRPLEEPYIPYPGSRSWGPRRVGPDELFVLGDNRTSSNDSRQWGMLPRDQVIGRALFCYWPPQNWGPMPHISFAERPQS